MTKSARHYTEQYILNPLHPVTINLIGCGGTGSQVLNSLGRMHSALQALEHPGLFIRAIDPDRVTEANMGRQLFSKSDIDDLKAAVLVGRVNRFFGTDWEAIPELYDENTKAPYANITISCVDSGPARKGIKDVLSKTVQKVKGKIEPADHNYLDHYERPYYWMDFGNMQDRGQVVMGTIIDIDQPQSEFTTLSRLKTIDEIHPTIFQPAKEDQGPSCSLAEALGKQDLFINTNLANMGLAILWKMFRQTYIEHNGLYLNLKTLSSNPIKIA